MIRALGILPYAALDKAPAQEWLRRVCGGDVPGVLRGPDGRAGGFPRACTPNAGGGIPGADRLGAGHCVAVSGTRSRCLVVATRCIPKYSARRAPMDLLATGRAERMSTSRSSFPRRRSTNCASPSRTTLCSCPDPKGDIQARRGRKRGAAVPSRPGQLLRGRWCYFVDRLVSGEKTMKSLREAIMVAAEA